MSSSENSRNESMPVSTSIDTRNQDAITGFSFKMSNEFDYDFKCIIDQPIPNVNLQNTFNEKAEKIKNEIIVEQNKLKNDANYTSSVIGKLQMYFLIYKMILSIFKLDYTNKNDFIKKLHSVIKNEHETGVYPPSIRISKIKLLLTLIRFTIFIKFK
jgi:hypothetical protein